MKALRGSHSTRQLACAALQDLKEKAPLRAKFGLKDEWVLPYEVCIGAIHRDHAWAVALQPRPAQSSSL